MLILVVDDSSFTRGLIRRDLGDLHRLVEAEDGLKGLALLERENPDLVFVDLLMPQLDGFEFLRRARKGGYKGCIVVCSANTQASVEKRVRELGASGFVAKPELVKRGRALALVNKFVKQKASAESSGQDLDGLFMRALDAAAKVLSQISGRQVVAKGWHLCDLDAAPGEEQEGKIQVSMSLGGGVEASGHVLLPEPGLVGVVSQRAGPLPPPGSSLLEVAVEMGNMLMGAFAACMADLSGREVVLSPPHCSSRYEQQGVREQECVLVRGDLKISGCEQAAHVMLLMDQAALDRLRQSLRSIAPLAGGS